MLTKLTETIIKSMAWERGAALKHLTDTGLSLAEHIIKRCIYSDDKDYQHWEKEITATLRKWQGITLKPKNKSIPLKDLVSKFNLWLDSPEELEVRITLLSTQRRLDPRFIKPYNKDKAYQSIRTLIDKLLLDVSKGSFVEFNNINYHIPTAAELG